MIPWFKSLLFDAGAFTAVVRGLAMAAATLIASGDFPGLTGKYPWLGAALAGMSLLLRSNNPLPSLRKNGAPANGTK